MFAFNCRSDAEKVPTVRKSIRQIAERQLVNGFNYDKRIIKYFRLALADLQGLIYYIRDTRCN